MAPVGAASKSEESLRYDGIRARRGILHALGLDS